jgi:carboxyl-terminal processing protease
MLPATNRGAGTNIGFPDVCNTPAGPAIVPIPYPNFGMTAQSTAFSPVVKVTGVNALNMGSQIPMTSGDEAGVAHPMIKGPGRYTMGNPIVSIDRMPAINLTCPSTGNNMNNGLGAQLVPSAVNVMYCRAGRDDDLATIMRGRGVTERQSLPGGIGSLRLEHITPSAPSEVYAAVERLDCRVLLIDLRGNPGGSLAASVALCRLFLPRGATVVRLEDHDGETTTLRHDADPALHQPLVLLIDETTASAAELFAASLQDHARALIVGRRSYGKRSAFAADAAISGRAPSSSLARWQRPGPARERIRPDVPIAARGDEAMKQAWAIALSLLDPPPA